MLSDPQADAVANQVRLVMSGDPMAVRTGLQTLVATPPLSHLPPDDRGMAEILLAEVLNNVVEHAYAQAPGDIEVTLARHATGLQCQVVDTGLAMPNERLPEGAPPDGISGPCDQIPEGGFGWNLIRMLSVDLCYERRGGQNRLSFFLPDHAGD